MDLLAGQVTNAYRSTFSGLTIAKERIRNDFSCASFCSSAERIDNNVLVPLLLYTRNWDIWSRRGCVSPFVVRARGNKNNKNEGEDDSQSSSSDADGARQRNTPGSGESSDTSFDLDFLNRDWRDFRAHMIKTEETESSDCSQGEVLADIKPRGQKWAHPLSTPEKGCILIATEKLDGIHTFERTVVLLFSMGSNNPRDGPFGVVINRPLNRKIGEMKLNNKKVAATFDDCSVHFGGPLEASILLLKGCQGEKLAGFEEVIPGLSFGTKNCLEEAAMLVKKGVLKPQDFGFFVGYSGWQIDQLRYEIELRYWHVAACSLDFLTCTSSENLWEEILQLMGGQYSDLSRKPRKDI